MSTIRHISQHVEAFCPLADASAYLTATLGASQDLVALGFTQAQVDAADYVLLQPLAADAWIRLNGTTAATTDGHRIASGELYQLDYHANLDNLQIAGSGACAITLMTFGSDPAY